jgi:hypothetical protein
MNAKVERVLRRHAIPALHRSTEAMKGIPMHPKVAQAIQEIDAAVFNSDTFDDEGERDELARYIERWLRELFPEPNVVFGEAGEREFYELMQAYRHAPHSPQRDVVEAYEAVKAHIKKSRLR